MQIVLDFPAPIAEALTAAVQNSGGEVTDLVVEAVRSSPLVQRALSDAYPDAVLRNLLEETHRG